MAVTLNESSTNKLVITIPSKGDTDWAPIVHTAMQKISDHDHTGNGMGAKIATAALEDSSVTTIKIADDAVTTAKIADSNVTTAKIADANVTTAKIADANVTTAKIADGAITADKVMSLALFSLDTSNNYEFSVESITGGETNVMSIMSAGNTSSYTIPSTGKYIISMQVKLADNRGFTNTRGKAYAIQFKEGSDVIGVSQGVWMENDDNDDDIMYNFTRAYNFTANDVITAVFDVTTSEAVDLDHFYGGCFLQIVQII